MSSSDFRANEKVINKRGLATSEMYAKNEPQLVLKFEHPSENAAVKKLQKSLWIIKSLWTHKI